MIDWCTGELFRAKVIICQLKKGERNRKTGKRAKNFQQVLCEARLSI